MITWALKRRKGSMIERDEKEEEAEDIQSIRGTQSAFAGFEVGRMGPWAKECVQPLEAKNVLQLTTSK